MQPEHEPVAAPYRKLARFFYGSWMIILGPVALWIVISSFWNMLQFFSAFSQVSWQRWLIAMLCVGLGMLGQLVYLGAVVTGTVAGGYFRLFAIFVAPALFVLLLIGSLMSQVLIWLFSFVFPEEWVYYFVEGPHSVGQAISMILGLMFWPLLLAIGVAKGVLSSGAPAVQLGCTVIRNLAATGVIDVSSLWSLMGELIMLPTNSRLLVALGYDLTPHYLDFKWWSSVSLYGYVETGAEIASCYANGALNGVGR